MADIKAAVDFRIQMNDYLKRYGIKQAWLAEQTGISRPHLSNMLSAKDKMTEDNRSKINTVLGTNF